MGNLKHAAVVFDVLFLISIMLSVREMSELSSVGEYCKNLIVF